MRVGIIVVFVHVFVLLSDFLLSCKHLCVPLISSKHSGGSGIKFNEIPRVKGADELPLNRLSGFHLKRADQWHVHACIICQSGASS